MDDEFMTAFFDGQCECTEYVLRIILDKSDLRVVSVQSQRNIPNLHGRSGRLDIKAADADGKHYDIEIQRADRGAGAKRARFNVGLMDTRQLKAGEDTEALSELYVIFITENDVLGAGKAVYHIDRVVAETGKLFVDMAHIVYVNNAYRGADAVGDLMHDFACRAVDGMKSRVLAERAKYLKGNEQEVTRMSYIVEELVNEAREDANMETAVKLLEQHRFREDELPAFFGFTPEQMDEVLALYREKNAVLA